MSSLNIGLLYHRARSLEYEQSINNHRLLSKISQICENKLAFNIFVIFLSVTG